MSSIRLFREVQSCQACLHSWEGHAHGFARGHTVLEKEGRIAFAADDLGYLVPRDDHLEVEAPLKALGWHQLQTCPKCGSRSLFPLACRPDSIVEVPCLSVGLEDLEKKGGAWTLSPEALRRFT